MCNDEEGEIKKISILCFFVVVLQDELVMSSLKVGSFLQILRSPEFFPSFIGILDCVGNACFQFILRKLNAVQFI